LIHCICGSDRIEEAQNRPGVLVDPKGKNRQATVPTVTCASCGLIRHTDLPFSTEEEYAAHYREQYPPVGTPYSAKNYEGDGKLARLRCDEYGIREGERILDVGCGSSRILRDLENCVGFDIVRRKLRYMRRYDKPVVEGTAFALPFSDAAFDSVVCSEVIEHIPEGPEPFLEMRRVLKPGGLLVLGTPDYGRRLWRIIERVYERTVPGGYAAEHTTHYTQQSLTELVQGLGFRVESVSYIFGCELVMSLRRP